MKVRDMIEYLVVYERTKTGYSAYAPDLPGVIAAGKTKAIVEKNIFGAIQFHLEGLIEEKNEYTKSTPESEMFVFAG